MAGKGQRFQDAGYTVSKPLLPVLGKPMILRALECMPKADKWVFVVRKDHLNDTPLIEALRSVHENTVIMVDENPVGQLDSCLVARAHYDNDEPLFVGACDFGMVYDENDYLKLLRGEDGPQPDMITWSFTEQINLSRNPTAWGWLKLENGNQVQGVSVKTPVSNDPFHDSAITGSFSFKSGKVFLEIADELIRRDIRVKGEHYIDSMLGLGVEMGKTVVAFPVTYIGWGTPVDYEEYLAFEKAFKNPEEHREIIESPEFAFWKKYFDFAKK
jgi:dTDP-glucose pyrophosphorylase